jgi:hypothetical protein
MIMKGCQYEERKTIILCYRTTSCFSDEYFLPSAVSKQPQENMNKDPTSKTNKELRIPDVHWEKGSRSNTCQNSSNINYQLTVIKGR